MKTKLLTVAAALSLAFASKAQQVFYSGFENWGTVGTFTNAPTDWMGSKTTSTIAVSQVTSMAEEGNYAINVQNTSSSHVRLTTQPVAIQQGMAYLVTYYAKGKGSVQAGLYTGTFDSTNANPFAASYGYYYANYQSVSGANWHKFTQTVVSDNTNSSGQFIISVKSTGTYTSTSGNIIGVDIDSVNIVAYPIPTNYTSLYDIQYTTASNGYSPYYGKLVRTGGIVTAQTVNTNTAGIAISQSFNVQTSNLQQWGGAYVYGSPGTHVNIGDSVNFYTIVDEYYSSGSTETEFENLDSATMVIVPAGTAGVPPVPAPLNLTTGAITGTVTTNGSEMYEGILVHFTAATCLTYTSQYSQGSVNDGSGATGVDKQFYTFTYTPGQSYELTGPVAWNFGWNIEPRMASDIGYTGIEKYNSLNAIFYPNPVGSQLNIQLSENANHISVSVIDIMGREMLNSVTASGNTVTLNNLQVAPGTYFVKVIADDKMQTVKIIKQ